MPTIVIILLSVLILILVLSLFNFKLEFKYQKTLESTKNEKEKEKLQILSNTELNILKLIAKGMSNQEIADKLFISVHTVKKHVSNIFKKLHFTSRSEARKYKDLIN